MEVTVFDQGDRWAAEMKLRMKLNNFRPYVWFTLQGAAVLPLAPAKPNRMNVGSVKRHLETLIEEGEPLEKKEENGITKYRRTGKISINQLLLDSMDIEEITELEDLNTKSVEDISSFQTSPEYRFQSNEQELFTKLVILGLGFAVAMPVGGIVMSFLEGFFSEISGSNASSINVVHEK